MAAFSGEQRFQGSRGGCLTVPTTAASAPAPVGSAAPGVRLEDSLTPPGPISPAAI